MNHSIIFIFLFSLPEKFSCHRNWSQLKSYQPPSRCAHLEVHFNSCCCFEGMMSAVELLIVCCMANFKYLFNMQMIPPSDSLGRTADVFPSKRHSPAAVTTQLPTLCYFSAGLWFTQWLQTSWLQARPLLIHTPLWEWEKWYPLWKDKLEEITTTTTILCAQ